MTSEFFWFVLAGFVAQLVDGTLGMAFGVTSSTLLLSVGIPPVTISATVHAAECLTSGISAASHHAFGNNCKKLFRKLLPPGILGAVAGAYILTRLPGEKIKPFVAVYLLIMGCIIIRRARTCPPVRSDLRHVVPLGFMGALLDAVGGGGWGPIVTTTLIANGNTPRETIGTVNTVEFFVTVAASVTFFSTIGFENWPVIAGLATGGAFAAPLGAWACRRLPRAPCMVLVGLLIVGLSSLTLWKTIRSLLCFWV